MVLFQIVKSSWLSDRRARYIVTFIFRKHNWIFGYKIFPPFIIWFWWVLETTLCCNKIKRISDQNQYLNICCCHNFIRWKYDKLEHILWDILFWFWFSMQIYLIGGCPMEINLGPTKSKSSVQILVTLYNLH